MQGTIVVPLDGSRLAESAIPLARSLAKRTGSRILLVSIVPVTPELSLWFHTPEVAHEWVTRRDEVQRYLDGPSGSFEGLEVETQVRFGNPVAEVIEIVRHVERPLLVMASHGHTGIKRLMVGSVAAQTVHSAPCPVVVVRAAEDRAPLAPPASRDHLLVALDGSQFAEEALRTARAIFGPSGLQLHLLRVIELSKWYMGGYEALDYSSLAAYDALDTYLQWARDDASSYLERTASELTAEGNEVTWETADGIAATRIIEVANERGAGLIVMATHGRTGLGRLLLGSVAEQVLHESSLPLLLVRPREAGALPATALSDQH